MTEKSIMYMPACLAVTLVAMNSTANAQPNDRDAARNVLEKSIAYRYGITCGELNIRLRTTRYQAQPIYETVEQVFNVYFEDPLLRVDSDWITPGKPSLHFYRTYDGQRLLVTDRTDMPMRVMDSPSEIPITPNMFHPRLIGMRIGGLTSLAHEKRIEQLIDSTLANDLTIKYTECDESRGEDLVRIDATQHNDNFSFNKTIWIAPKKGHSVVKMVSKKQRPNSIIIATLECEIKQQAGGVWFPSTVCFKSIRDSQVQHEETASLTKAIFTRCPNRRVYTLEGLGLEPGTQIMSHESGLIEWNGKQLVRPTIHQFSSSGKSANQATKSLWYIALCALSFAALFAAIYILFVRRHHRWTLA